RDALTDTLTGIANRKNFDASLRDAVTTTMETGAPLSLLMIDIDHF
ncbi:MAG TPA: GGDEF domain-containing protein, partial [Thalassospira sp.]|nr:GGDEF domain-containing protein [Thalassospira sp.]